MRAPSPLRPESPDGCVPEIPPVDPSLFGSGVAASRAVDLGPGGITEDALLGGRVRLLQYRGGHRAGTDAVLLAGLTQVRPGDDVVDLGAATGAVGLMIAARAPGTRITFVERDPALADLCRRNLDLNEWSGRARVVAANIFAHASEGRAADLPDSEADLVATNPPFFEAAARPSPQPGRRAARTMAGGDLGGWLRGAARLLRPRGRLALLHRADHLDRCIGALAEAFGSIEIQPVYGRAGQPASRILIEAVKGGRAALQLHAPLVLHEADGSFTPAARRLHAGVA